MYIHEHDNWTDFRWEGDKIFYLVEDVARVQGHLYGRLSDIGFESKIQAVAENLKRDIIYTSEIEGVRLNSDEVRSSIARRLGIENVKHTALSHYIDAVVAVMVDAMEHYDLCLTKEKLCAWQSAFFPTGYSEGSQIEVGKYRTHEEHIVSGYFGRERVHYIAPSPDRIEHEMARFINWFNTTHSVPSVICSAIAHLWFVSIHPFEDGNGRLARILGDMFLARGDKSRFRFYNVSTQINRDKKHYYEILERTQRGDGDITEWLIWYLQTLLSAIADANAIVNTVLNKAFFWMHAASIPMTERQTRTLNRFLDGYEAKITTKNWAELNKCSSDTAGRDIRDLQRKGILLIDILGAKRPSYSINYGVDPNDLTTRFSDVQIIKEDNDNYYLTASYSGKAVKERVIKLDAERCLRGDLPIKHLLGKYFSYLL